MRSELGFTIITALGLLHSASAGACQQNGTYDFVRKSAFSTVPAAAHHML
jgi:hypothetical protein